MAALPCVSPYTGAGPSTISRDMARILIIPGVLLVVIGLLWGPLSRLGLGRLPGDIVI